MSKITINKKTAIILFNLGGPDNLDSVKPFLYNLFNDKYIITLPSFFRKIIARLISSRREETAKEIYELMGGGSSILPETKVQAEALEKALKKKGQSDFKIFICMRHWHPMSDKIIKEVEEYMPDELIMLPLYPQFSTTTSLSSLEDFKDKIANSKLKSAIQKSICCYPDQEDFINSHIELIEKSQKEAATGSKILFSAHGLPEKIINSGDSYQWQIELTVSKVAKKMNLQEDEYQICYQSKVGPMKWIGPSTEDLIEEYGKEGRGLIIVPIAFVSEHSETTVELDIEYKEIADKYKISYNRVPTLSVNDKFIESLANIVIGASNEGDSFTAGADAQGSSFSRRCPAEFGKCPCGK